MSRYIYRAKKGPQDFIEGTIEAETESLALSKLSQMGYFPLSLRKEEFSGKVRLRPRDLANFTRQLATLLDAGLTLFKALQILRAQTENKYLQQIIDDLTGVVKDGRTFSEALMRHSKVFSEVYISMIKAGEVGGMLEKVLSRLADFAEEEQEIKGRVWTAMAYPIFMAVVGLFTVIILLTFVIPRLVVMFDELGGGLPLPTHILIVMSRIFTKFWWLISAVILVSLFVIKRGRDTPQGKLTLDRFKLNLPLWGQLRLKAELHRFGHTLGTLLANGVPILQSIRVVSETVENEVLRQELRKIGKEIMEGSTLTQSMSKNRYFPLFVTNMIGVGEESGSLEKTLFKIADAYEREVNRMIRLMTSLLEPMMILLVGSIVAFIVIAMLLPIFQINIMAR